MNLRIDDEPMAYAPARGPRISLQLRYGSRMTNYLGTNFFGLGRGWKASIQSFIHRSSGIYYVHLPHGGVLSHDDLTLLTGSDLEVVLDGNLQLTNFVVSRTDGSRSWYSHIVTNQSGAFQYAFLTHEMDPLGNTTQLHYSDYDPSNPVIRLLNVVDADGLTNLVGYASSNPSSTNLISHVVSPHGATNHFHYNGLGLLTNVVDVSGLGTGFLYNSDGWITNMTTPYGTHSFRYTKGASPIFGVDGSAHGRSVHVTQPNGGRHYFLYLNQAAGIPSSYDASELPNTTNANFAIPTTLDNLEMDLRNSFHWTPRQYELLNEEFLASMDHSDLGTNDFRLARLRHWLEKANDHPVGVISMEREPSPDAAVEGLKTWYDYNNKMNPVTEEPGPSFIGEHGLPLLVAVRHPGGWVQFTRTERNAKGKVTRRITTYTMSDGSIGLRTNTFLYAANDIDLVATLDADGALSTTNIFNASHQVLTNRNALGEETVFHYLPDTRLPAGITFPTGLTQTNLYDSNQRLQSVIDVGLATNQFSWTASLLTSHTDPRGLSRTFAYDSLQRLVRVGLPDGSYVSNRYDKLDLVAQRDRAGQWTTFGYDSVRNLVAVTNRNHRVTTYSWCLCGSLESMTDPLDQTTSYHYDVAGRRVGVHHPDGTWLTNHYNGLGQITHTLDSGGYSLTNHFNNQGLLVASSNALGALFRARYDIHDLPVEVTDRNGLTVTNVHDPLHRLIQTIDAEGASQRFLHSARGLVALTNQLGHLIRWAYDAAGRQTHQTNALGQVLSMTYNGAGDLLSLTDERGHATTWNYDAYGQPTNKLDHTGAELFRYGYDTLGRLTQRWTPAKGQTTYTYDVMGNLIQVDYPLSADVSLAYDALDRLTNRVDALGTTRYTYNAMGQITSEDGPWDADTVALLHAQGRRSHLTVPVPGGEDRTLLYGYDAIGRLQSLSSPEGSYTYSHHPGLGGMATASSLVRKLVLPNGAYVTNAFDSLGRLETTALAGASGAWLNSHAYQHNAAHQRTRQTRHDNSRVDYDYDSLGQLTGARGHDQERDLVRWHEQLGYAYDAAGNLAWRTNHALVQAFALNPLNQITNLTRTGKLTVAGSTTAAATQVTVNGQDAFLYQDASFAYTNWTLAEGLNEITALAQDALDRTATHTISVQAPAQVRFEHDANGNLLSDGHRSFAWDDENQLVQVLVTNQWKSLFEYDGELRRRVRREYLWQNGQWHGVLEVRYLYDGNLVIQERHYDPRLSATRPIQVVHYTRGLDLSGTHQGAGGIGGLLGRSTFVPATGQESAAYYHADGNGNVTAMIDAEQAVVARYVYDPFGGELSRSGPLAEANLYRFSSKECHPPSGLIHYLYRYYDPNLQRWPNRDPIGDQSGLMTRKKLRLQAEAGWNLYAFCLNDSLNRADIDGRGFASKIITIFGGGGKCCNNSPSPIWYVDDGVWHKLPAGQCTGTFVDCDGFMCGGTFYAVSTLGSGQCNNNSQACPISGYGPPPIPPSMPYPGGMNPVYYKGTPPVSMPLPNPRAPSPLPVE